MPGAHASSEQEVNGPFRWVLIARVAHVLAKDEAGGGANFLTVCEIEVAFTTSVYRVAPSRTICPLCQHACGLDLPPAGEFPATPTVF